jgi:hypothetical protein
LGFFGGMLFISILFISIIHYFSLSLFYLLYCKLLLVLIISAMSDGVPSMLALFAHLSACSFPTSPIWLGTHTSVNIRFSISNAELFLRILLHIVGRFLEKPALVDFRTLKLSVNIDVLSIFSSYYYFYCLINSCHFIEAYLLFSFLNYYSIFVIFYNSCTC